MDIKLEVNKLTIAVLLGDGTPSASGKTLVVATTNGFISVAGSDIRLSLNVVKPRNK